MRRVTPGTLDLRGIRLGHELREQDMADEIGVSRGKVSHVENGRQGVSAYDVRRWARAYGVSVDLFLMGMERDKKARKG